MKFLCGVAFVLAACYAIILENPNHKNVSERYFVFVGDDDEEWTLVDSTDPVDEELIRKYTGDPDNHGYWLFTRGNPRSPQILRFNNDSTIINSNFNKDKITVFLSHGWIGSCNSRMNTVLTEAFLQDQDVNVIVLDWSVLAAQGYITAVSAVPAVGRNLGRFIKWLVSLGASYERLHIVGFSLGGHVVGNAGRETGGKVKRITALDPAGPLWLLNPNRLNKPDGQYVEVIHTSFLCGHHAPCGNADFYPNGGLLQPGCTSISCSHYRAYELMAASLKFNHLKANECRDMAEMKFNECSGEIELMGNGDLMAKRPGIYRVNTKKSYAYDVTETSIF